MPKRRSARVSKAEDKRRAARRAELRAARKKAAEALRRRRSRAAKKGWVTRKAKKVTTSREKSRKVKTPRDDIASRKVKIILAQIEKPKKRSPLEVAVFALEHGLLEKLRVPKKLRKEARDLLARATMGFLEDIAKAEPRAAAFLSPHRRRKAVAEMTTRQQFEIAARPTFEHLQERAGSAEDTWTDEDGDKHNAFWYH